MMQEVNKEAREWTKETHDKLVQQFTRLDIQHRPNSPSTRPAVEQLKEYFRHRQGTISRITFKFPRHMVFVHKGVGRGRPASNPGKGKEWFNPVIEEKIDDLATRVANALGDVVVNNLKIR